MFTKILGFIVTFAIVRAVVSIGFGVVTYGAVIYALKNALSLAKQFYNTMPMGVLNFLALAGMPDFIGIIVGALVARASLQFAKRLAMLS